MMIFGGRGLDYGTKVVDNEGGKYIQWPSLNNVTGEKHD